MFKQLEGARLGIFIFLGTVILVISIFLLGNKEKLFSSTIEIKSYFNQIEGLKTGAPVRLSGYDVGSVSSISLTSGDTTGNVEVRMRIDNELKHFIRLDSKAAIETEGLVGKKIITITPGDPNLSEISSGGVIKSKVPVNIGKIIEQTESVMGYLKDLTKEFSEIFKKVNAGEGTIGKLVNDDKLYKAAVNITQTADKSLDSITHRLSQLSDFMVSTSTNIKNIIGNVDNTIKDMNHIIEQIDKGEGVVGMLISDKKLADSVQTIVNNLAITSTEAKEATSKLSENMEALKHNWLFKNYFEQRGYWDKLDYENQIDVKLKEIRDQNKILDEKIQILLDLEKKLNIKKND